MASHGQKETATLQKNLQAQLDRLLLQLEDLDELREEIDDDEYEEIKRDTKEQLQEMQEQMDKMLAGNMSLVSEFGAMRLALQAAIADAFQTPEVIRLFARKEAPTLRVRLAAVDQDHKLGKISPDTYKSQTLEIIVALKKLGEELTADEKAFLRDNDDAMAQFESADQGIDSTVVSSAVGGAAQG
ncbi:LZIC [Symbiodinium sp. KB8]|nr:LZIC [Symbiodinium sp. KB8]